MKIKGIPVGTTMPRSDWKQNDPKRADYIKNKPTDLLHGTDSSLSVSGKAADAAATGKALKKCQDESVKIFSGPEEPDDSLGKDGDIYILFED